MAPQRPEDGFVRMPEHEFEAILARAAEEGAKRALADVGLEGDEAALDIRDLRSMLDLLRLVRRTAVQTVVRAVNSAVLDSVVVQYFATLLVVREEDLLVPSGYFSLWIGAVTAGAHGDWLALRHGFLQDLRAVLPGARALLRTPLARALSDDNSSRFGYR